jgi:hypothetical protein
MFFVRSAIDERHRLGSIQVHAAYRCVAPYASADHRSERAHRCESTTQLILVHRRTLQHYVRKFGPATQDTSTATAAELNAVYGPFTANSGTYEVKGGTLTTHPLLAKNPAVMAPGAANTYSFKIEGKTLTLTSVTGGRGPVTNPVTFKLTRIE